MEVFWLSTNYCLRDKSASHLNFRINLPHVISYCSFVLPCISVDFGYAKKPRRLRSYNFFSLRQRIDVERFMFSEVCLNFSLNRYRGSTFIFRFPLLFSLRIWHFLIQWIFYLCNLIIRISRRSIESWAKSFSVFLL